MKIARALTIGLGCLLGGAVLAGTPPAPPADGKQLLAEMRSFFAGAEVRHPGTPGNLLTEQRVAERFAKSGFRHGQIRFEAPTFMPGRTRITAGRLPPIRLFPMHPTIFRPGNFPAKDFTTKLVYLGHGTVADLEALKGVPLEGAIALMEFNCGGSWQRFLRFGVKGLIFIAPDEYSHSEAVAKVYATEVSVPRFFVNAAEGARLKEAVKRSARSLGVRIEAEPSRWRNVFLRDLWVLIPGSSSDLEKEVCVFVAPMDSNCIVPELAAGAQSGANLYLLLRLLDEFKKTPPARSMLLVAVNAHTQYFLGERMLAWHLLAPDKQVAAVRDLLAAEMRTQDLLFKTYQRLKLAPPSQAEEDLLIEMRTLVDASTGRKIKIKEPMVALARRDVNQTKAGKLVIQRSQLSDEQKRKEIERLDELYAKHVNVLTLFNRVGVRTKLSDLSPEEVDILRGYVADLVRTNRTWARLNRRDLKIDVANGSVREALAGRSVPVSFTLDLTWRGDRIGFSSLNMVAMYATKRGAERFGRNTTRVAAAIAGREWRGRANPFVDTMTKVGGWPEEHFFPAYDSAIHCFHAVQRSPAFSLRTVFAAAGSAFTPADTFDRLAPARVAGLMAYVPILVRGILADRAVTSSGELPPPRPTQGAYSIHIKAFKFDEFSASVMPQLPVSGSAIVLVEPAWSFRPIVGGGVVNAYFALTDERAGRMFYCVDHRRLASSALHYDPDFTTVDHAIDAGETHARVSSNVTQAERRTFALFPCKEIPLYERNDPSRLSASAIGVYKVIPLGAMRDAVPRRYGLGGVQAQPVSTKWIHRTAKPGAIYVERDEAVKLVAGRKGLALNASPEEPEGEGFSSAEELGPDPFLASARDLSVLNRYRLSKMRGISNQLAHEFLARGDDALRRMAAAKAHRDHVRRLRRLYEALGAQTKAHGWTSAITNDMLKAIVFYLALLLPFCFFVQKLVFKFARIEAQMAAFAVLFTVTYVLFRHIHPAFEIAKAPAAIFIAFVMGALGVFVIYILHSRFEGEMQMLFRTFTAMDASEVGYSTAGREAMLIGVSNMKRRRIRTALTTGTIVLVTFSMLAFSSVSQKMSPTIIPVTRTAPYTGIFYQWPGNLRMDEASLHVFLDLFEGRGETIVRRWMLTPPSKQWGGVFEFRAECRTGHAMEVQAVLGLSVADDGFLGEMPVLPGGRFFSSNHASEVVLSAGAATDALKIPPDQIGTARVTFHGREFTVVGLVDDEQLRSMKDLNNLQILPIKHMERRGEVRSEVMTPDAEGVLDESGIDFVETAKLLILPVETAKRLGAAPFSVSVRFKDDTPIWPVIDEVLTTTRAKFYAGSRVNFKTGKDGKRLHPAGVYYIGSGYKTSVGGLTRLIIPLLIAATIIFNTLLGTVYERKHEIAIYNAVGLNPTHIGLFFLAEAFVYSVLGSVGGYLIGQLLAIGLTKFELVKGINLNFSSLSVVYVILFTIGVVLLSTLYPAIMATRAAVPSGKRKWSMPAHTGNRMTVVFPFIYQPSLVGGIMAYLEEYFARFTEASTGTLIASIEQKSKGHDEQGRETYTLVYDIALAPFDLGVTQKVTFRAAHDDVVQSHRVTMDILRVSGQDSNWVTTNKPFLERLRKYLMHWRNLNATQHAAYAQRAAELFKQG